MWRGLKGEDVCSDFDDAGTVAIAAVSAVPESEDPQALTISLAEESVDDVAALADFDTAAGSPEAAPAAIVSPELNAKDGERLMIAGKRVWSERLDADLYYVIGSFSKRGNARAMIGKYQDLGPAVMASRLDGVEIYRVAVGPFAADQKREMRLRLKLVGLSNAWAMRVDHRQWTLASPKVLSMPTQSVAKAPEATPVEGAGKPVRRNGSSEEIAETPTAPNDEQGQSSKLIENGKLHLVIGSFSNKENATNYAKAKADLSPQVLSSETADGWRHRVVIGPYAKAESIKVRRALVRTGIENIWALDLTPRAVSDETMMADVLDTPYVVDQGQGMEIAETPSPEPQKVVSNDVVAPVSSDQKMGWGVNLVEYIFDMFRSSDTTDVVGVVPPLES